MSFRANAVNTQIAFAGPYSPVCSLLFKPVQRVDTYSVWLKS